MQLLQLPPPLLLQVPGLLAAPLLLLLGVPRLLLGDKGAWSAGRTRHMTLMLPLSTCSMKHTRLRWLMKPFC